MDILKQVLYPVVEEFKKTLPNAQSFVCSPDTVLMGSDSCLDSMAVVSFIVAVEASLQDKTGKAVTIVSEKAMSRKHSPFRTLKTLADFIAELLAGAEKIK